MAQLLPIASLVFTVASTAFKIIGGVQQAKSAEAAANAQAKAERQRASFVAEQDKKRARRLASKQKAQFAFSGVTLGGSPSAVILEDLKEGAIGSLDILRQGEGRARIAEARGAQARASIGGIVAGGLAGIGGTLLTQGGAFNTGGPTIGARLTSATNPSFRAFNTRLRPSTNPFSTGFLR